MAKSSVTAEEEQEENLEEMISSLVNQMNTLNAAIAQERHANRMLQVDYEYTLEQKSK